MGGGREVKLILFSRFEKMALLGGYSWSAVLSVHALSLSAGFPGLAHFH